MLEKNQKTKLKKRGKITVENLLFTLSHELGNHLVPLGHLLSKINEGHELTMKEKKIMFDSYQSLETTLNSFRKLQFSKDRPVSTISDKSGFIQLINFK
ncbi:MAG: hypothetical protein OXB88_09850 [Bacteriovoracales bacterium]|nr:hypothetical protein [Bacteriovoracales bacterium]